MPRRNFAAFILTHGRPDKILTHKSLRAAGYTGPIYFILDNEDKAADGYRERFGSDNVIVFDKKAEAAKADNGNNFGNLRVTQHARNASFGIAERLGLTHFWQLDDDYFKWIYRLGRGRDIDDGSLPIRRMDCVIGALLDFFDSTPIKTMAFSQGGDHIGGFSGIRLKRKAMNSFICSPSRPFRFMGTLNDDVNSYVMGGKTGGIFFTFTGLQLDQPATQAVPGGMTEAYLAGGTYQKSFTTVMYSPSAVKCAMAGGKFYRIHHRIDWNAAVPKIVPEFVSR